MGLFMGAMPPDADRLVRRGFCHRDVSGKRRTRRTAFAPRPPGPVARNGTRMARVPYIAFEHGNGAGQVRPGHRGALRTTGARALAARAHLRADQRRTRAHRIHVAPVDAARPAGGQPRAAYLAARALCLHRPAELPADRIDPPLDRKSTRLNSSHVKISYAVFCLKKKTNAVTKIGCRRLEPT